MIDQKITLDRAGAEVLDAAMQVEGIGATLTAMASDADGLRAVSPMQLVRALELLAGCCDGTVHKLGVIHDTLEDLAADGEQEGAENG